MEQSGDSLNNWYNVKLCPKMTFILDFRSLQKRKLRKGWNV